MTKKNKKKRRSREQVRPEGQENVRQESGREDQVTLIERNDERDGRGEDPGRDEEVDEEEVAGKSRDRELSSLRRGRRTEGESNRKEL